MGIRDRSFGKPAGLLRRIQLKSLAEFQEKTMVVMAVGGAEQLPVGGNAQLLFEQKVVQHESDPVFCLPLHCVHGTAVYCHGAAILLIEVHQSSDESCLSGSVAADQPENVPGLESQRNILKMQGADARCV